ncbi:MAG: tetratricopeptide repeat protein, partial [Isosphaeraceae bacterium]
LAAWDAWLNALADAGEIDALGRELGRVPSALADSPELAAHRGRVAQESRRFPEAVAAYEEALRARPHDPKLLYRLARALRFADQVEAAQEVEARAAAIDAATKELKDAYRDASAVKTLGLTPEPALYQRLADLRERLGKPREALAWHRLVLQVDPTNALSRDAVGRLEASSKPGTE